MILIVMGALIPDGSGRIIVLSPHRLARCDQRRSTEGLGQQIVGYNMEAVCVMAD